MSLQYDQIAAKYAQVANTAATRMQHVFVREALGDLHGQVVLDLGCGAGSYTRTIADLGATTVFGCDISSGMIDLAKASTTQSNITYSVADCMKPLEILDSMEGQFDLVTGIWLLHYASDEAEMDGFWKNIARALKPSGRFLGLVPFPGFYDKDSLVAIRHYEATLTPLYKTKMGLLNRVTFHTTDPPFEFDCYHYDAEVYEVAARANAFEHIRWLPNVVPKSLPADIPPSESEYWDDFRERSSWIVMEATRG